MMDTLITRRKYCLDSVLLIALLGTLDIQLTHIFLYLCSLLTFLNINIAIISFLLHNVRRLLCNYLPEEVVVKKYNFPFSWRRQHFPSLYKEHRRFLGVEASVSQMKDIIRNAVVEYDLVNEDFLQPYLTLVDALRKETEALFDLFPNGVVRFELTKENGIKMLFRTDLSSDGKILTVTDVEWVYVPTKCLLSLSKV